MPLQDILDALAREAGEMQPDSSDVESNVVTESDKFGLNLLGAPQQAEPSIPTRAGFSIAEALRSVGEAFPRGLAALQGLSPEDYEKLKALQPGRLEAEAAPKRLRQQFPAETRAEVLADIAGPVLSEVALTSAAPQVKGLSAGKIVFDSLVDGALGAKADPEDRVRGFLLGAGLGAGASGVAGKLLGRGGVRQAGLGIAEGAGRKAPRVSPSGKELLAPRQLEEVPLELIEKAQAQRRLQAFHPKSSTRKADFEIRSQIRDRAGVADKGTQDKYIRSLPGEARAVLADRLRANIGPDGKIIDENFLLRETEKMRDLALKADHQRGAIQQLVSDAIRAGGKTTLAATKELSAVSKSLDRLPADILLSLRESLESMTDMGRAKFPAIWTSKICGSPCVPVEEAVVRWPAIIKEIRQASMLSGLGTWARNIFGTGSRIGINPARDVAAGLIDIPTAAIRGRERVRFAGEGFADIMGMWHGLKVMGRRRAVQGKLMKSAEDSPLGDVIDFGIATREMREGRRASESAIGEALQQTRLAGTRTAKGAQFVTQAPFQALNWQDETMMGITYAGEMFRSGYRQAIREGKKGMAAYRRAGQVVDEQSVFLRGMHKEASAKASSAANAAQLKPSELEQNVVRQWKKMVDTAKPDVATARQMAERAIFIAREGRKLDSFIDVLDNMDKEFGGLVSVALPFRRTPANVMRETVRTSPVGLVTPFIQAKRPGGIAAGEMMDRLGQAAVGTAAMYGALSLADRGFIQLEPFGREKSRADRLTKEAAGVAQDSLVLNGWSIPVDRIEPIGPLLLAAARASELQRNGDIEGAGQAATMAAWSAVDFAKDAAFMESFSQFVEAITADDRKSNRFFQRLGGSFVPTAVKDARRWVFGAPLTEVEPLKGPISLHTLPVEVIRGAAGSLGFGDRARLGVFGKDRPALPLGIKTEQSPIAKELLNIGVSVDIPRLPSDITEIASDERDVFIKAKGMVQESELRRVMRSPRYQSLNAEAKAVLVKRTLNQINTRMNKRARAIKGMGRPWTTRDLLRGFIRVGG
jgi:hypothetical protein